MIVYGALARAEALFNKVEAWWAVEAFDPESKTVIKVNPIYQERFNDDTEASGPAT